MQYECAYIYMLELSGSEKKAKVPSNIYSWFWAEEPYWCIFEKGYYRVLLYYN